MAEAHINYVLKKHPLSALEDAIADASRQIEAELERVRAERDRWRDAGLLADDPLAVALGYSLETWERECIERALSAADGRKGEAARLLGISRTTLNRKLEKYEGLGTE